MVKTTIFNWFSQMHPGDQFFLVISTNQFLQCTWKSDESVSWKGWSCQSRRSENEKQCFETSNSEVVLPGG